jgi:dTDP-4-dehydrorhamnose reductase
MRVLITGAHGQLGYELDRKLRNAHSITALDRTQLDLADPNAIRKVVRSFAPEYILNAAAYTNVDGAESDRDRAFMVNAVAPGILAEEAAGCGAAIVHFSTDYVFDGTKPAAYVEDDLPNPLSAYGASKLAGEQAVMNSNATALVIRTSWVYAARGNNFFLKIFRLMEGRPELRVVSDQVGAPTSAKALAGAVAQILAQNSRHTGLYHLTASGSTTWHGFAEHIRTAAIQAGIPLSVQNILPISTAQFGAPARRPANSMLCCAKIERDFGLNLQDWQSGFADVFTDFFQSRPRSSASTT